jgi:chromosomal replication initiation ATPase DnaA
MVLEELLSVLALLGQELDAVDEEHVGTAVGPLNALYETERQLGLTCDRLPALVSIEQRLRERSEGGLVASPAAGPCHRARITPLIGHQAPRRSKYCRRERASRATDVVSVPLRTLAECLLVDGD